MSIRDESYEFGDALAEAIIMLTDDKPNGEEATAIMQKAFTVVMEGKDFVSIPKDERLEAVMLALARVLNKIAEAKIVFSDEQTEGD